MNSQLKLFTDPAVLARVQRPILTRFLEDNHANLPAGAATLLRTSLNGLSFEEFCSAWATQFGSANQFGPSLLDALHRIEFLALPENASILADALSHLPPGYEINRNFSTLHQALHLWMLAHSPAGVTWPTGGAERPLEAPAPASAKIGVGSSEIEEERKETAAEAISQLPSFISSPDEDPAESEAQADTVPIRRLQPWPDPVPEASPLFDQVHDRALHYLYLPPGAAVVFTLWPGHAHCVKAFTHSPRLYVTSTEAGCGKTTALDFIACLCPDVLRTDNLKPAVLYRVTHKHEPTLVLDEFDSYAHQYPDLRGLINAGHNLHGCATRCEGPNVRFFKAYAATAIAGIGDLAPTLAQRSIIIRLAKAPAGALKARFDRRHIKFETTLGRKIARWVQDNYAAIAACDPVMPPECINRLADNWRPLFAIAQIIGGHWPQRVLEAFNQLTAKRHLEDPDLVLLSDIRSIFARAGTSRMFSSQLVELLRALPNRPWSATARAVNQTWLGRRLSRFGVHSFNLRIGSARAKGYDLADFSDAFARFLPPPSSDGASQP
jgi:hypothetical protein